MTSSRLGETANASGFDLDYDLRVYDDPQALHEAIVRKNEETRLSRVVAGIAGSGTKKAALTRMRLISRLGSMSEAGISIPVILGDWRGFNR